MIRALALYSGSRASNVAVVLAERVGVFDLKLVHFSSPFFCGGDEVRAAAQELFPNLPFRSHTLKREHLRLGAKDGLPFPCGFCRRVILAKTARMAKRLRVELVITGEMVGRGGLGPAEIAELDAQVGLSNRVLRPLSARLLPKIRPDIFQCLDREALLDLSLGDEEKLRSLARTLGVEAGVDQGKRCLLTRPAFAARLVQLADDGPLTVNTLKLLEFEHFYLAPPGFKVVVARRWDEQERLQTLFLPTDMRVYLPIPHSPLVLIRANWAGHSPAERLAAIHTAAAIALAVADLPEDCLYPVCFRFEWEDETHRLSIFPFPKDQLAELALDNQAQNGQTNCTLTSRPRREEITAEVGPT